MEQNMFYDHVSSWIDSYFNPEALQWMRRFVDNSAQPRDIKDSLHQKIDRKLATLRNVPVFEDRNGIKLLMDKQGHPRS